MLNRRILLLPLALILCANSAKAQQSEVQRLSQRVERLERRVVELERRLQSVEPAPTVQSNAPRAASGDWKQIDNWRRLRKGMTMEDVSNLLGRPDRVDASVLTHWSYGEIADDARVTFDPQQRVMGWSEPRRQ